MFQNCNNNPNQFNNFDMNPSFQQAFNNMGQNNQNNNQMELNYYLMQMMNMNPYLFQMNNNSHQNFMFMPSSNFNNNNGFQDLGILPRPNQISNLMNDQDSFPGIPGPRINATFMTSTGITKNISTPYNVTVKELIFKFAEKVGINPILALDKIVFISNGLSIKGEDLNKTVHQYFQSGYNKFQVKIIVFDKSNIIGAYDSMNKFLFNNKN